MRFLISTERKPIVSWKDTQYAACDVTEYAELIITQDRQNLVKSNAETSS
jgi:hypothetical protein